MKKLCTGSLWRYIPASLVIGASLLLSSTLSLGDIRPNAISSPATSSQNVDCRLVPNPDECYHQQSKQQWSPYSPSINSVLPPLNTQSLGLEGPFSAELKYDNDLDWILGLKYLQMFNESTGIAAKVTGGANEFRGNLTVGYSASKDHQLKVTYEFLTQNLPFDFASGTINEWVAQHSIGAAYQYVIRHEIVHSLELSGYITRAKTKDLDPQTFNQQTITAGSAYVYDVNYRRIAGGRENTVLATVNLFPFANDQTSLTLGGGYSSIVYDTIYEDNQAATRPAFKAELTHLLTPKLKFTAGTVGSAASTEYNVGVSHLLPKQFEVALKGQYTTGNGTLLDSKTVTLGITYPAAESYSLSNFSELQELKNWLDKPVIYSARVLAIKDEMVQRFEVKAGPTLPNQFKFFDQFIDPVLSTIAFIFPDPNAVITYSVTTIKIAQGNNKVNDSQDYTQILNLALVPNGLNQVNLQSTAGLPPFLDPDQQISSQGTYQITIFATYTPPKGAAFSLQNGFELTIDGDQPPDWDSTSIPAANMGFVYPNGGPEIDLTAKVTVHAPDTSANITIVDGGNCPAHPDWLSVAPCNAQPTHTCLTSGATTVPIDVPDQTFCVRLEAAGFPGGNSTPKEFDNISIIQDPPVWTLPSTTPTLSFDSLPSQPVLLAPYITSGTTGLAFQQGDGFDTTHWSLSGGQLKLIAADTSFLGTHQIPIIATNTTSFIGGVSQMVPVDVVNRNYTVNWTSNTLTDAQVDAPYSKALNPMGLLETRNSGTVVPGDTYNFTLDSSSDTDWKVINNNLQYKDGNTPIPALETVTIVLTATSTFSGNQPVPPTKTFTLTVGTNPALTVEWTDNTVTNPQVGAVYSKPLNAMSLLDTKNGDIFITDDTYTFTLVSTSDSNWTVTSDGQTLQYKNGTVPIPNFGADITITLTAISTHSGTGPTLPQPTNKQFTLHIDPNPGLSVTWTGNTLTNATVDNVYKEGLNGMNLLKTQNGSTPVAGDTYTFTLEQTSDPNWNVTEDGLTLQYLDGTVPVPALGTVTLKLSAKSAFSAGPASPPDKTFNLIINQNTGETVTWTNQTLVPATLNAPYNKELNPMLLVQTVNGSTPVPDDTYKFKLESTSDPNWNVYPASDPSPAPPSGLILRYKDGTVPVPSTTSVTIVLSAVSDHSGQTATPTPKTFTLQVGPDTGLTVKWTGNTITNPQIFAAYDAPLNPMNLLETDSGTTPQPDTYNFRQISTTDSNWNVYPASDPSPAPPSGLNLRYKTGVEPVPAFETVTIVLAAISNNSSNPPTSGGDPPDSHNKTFTFTVGPNPHLTVGWTAKTLTDAAIDAPYQKALNPMGLIATDEDPNDTYTFTRISTSDPDWNVTPDGKTLQYKTGVELIPTASLDTTVTLVLTAISTDSSGQPDPHNKTFTLKIGKNSALTVDWTSSTLPPAQIFSTYSQPLNPMGLLETKNGTTVVPGDTYNYTLVSTSDTGWDVTNNTLEYKNGTVPVPAVGTVTIKLTATSIFSGNSPSTGGDLPPPTVNKTFTLTINPDTGIQPAWINPGSPGLPAASAGVTYTQHLNAINLTPGQQIVATPNDATDQYDFSFENNTPPPGWSIDQDPTSGMRDILTATGLTPGTATIHLQAKSRDTGNFANNGSVSAEVMGFTIQVNSVPVFKPSPTGAIKFDTTGDATTFTPNLPELGNITDGINLNALLIDGGTGFPNLNITFEDGTTATDDWVIKPNPSSPHQFFLLRKLTTGTTNKVSATGVSQGPTPGVPLPQPLKACVDSSPTSQCSSTDDPSLPTAFKIWVKPEPGVVYNYFASQPVAISLTAATSDGNGHRATVLQPALTPPLPTQRDFNNLLRFTSANANAPQIINDSDATFAAPTNPRGYVDYTQLPQNTLKLLSPNNTEFVTLAQNQDSTYLNAFSSANGNNGANNGNLKNLPPLTSGKLILVPYQKELLTTRVTGSYQTAPVARSYTGNLSYNVGVGIWSAQRAGIPCIQANTTATTAFIFTLPQAPTGQWKLTAAPLFNGYRTPGSQEVGICQGKIIPTVQYFKAADSSGGSCGGDGSLHSGGFTWDTSTLTDGNVRCSGGTEKGHVVGQNAQLASVPLGPGNGDFTLYALDPGTNGGLIWPKKCGTGSTCAINIDNRKPPDIPDTYANFLTSPVQQQRGTRFGTDYSNYPYVVLGN